MTTEGFIVPKSRSLDALSSVDYELEQIDYAEMRSMIERRFNMLVKSGVLCIDLLHNQAMKAKVILDIIDKEGLNYIKHGQLVFSMFENIWKWEIHNIPSHTRIDLEHWMKTGQVRKLNDEEYLRQSVLISKC